MRIYPSTSNIIETERVKPKDLALSYISTDNEKLDVNIIKEAAISKYNSITPVIPYQEFNSPAPFLFDSNGVKVDTASYMQRDKDRYLFMPKDIVEFMPDRFAFTATVKKNMKYKSNMDYNIKIACADSKYDYCRSLIKIFGDAPRRGLCPNNISINNRDINIESLYNSAIANNDIMFIESSNGLVYGDTSNAINFNDIMKSCTNTWLIVDSFANMQEGPDTCDLSSPTIYDKTKYTINGYIKSFNLDVEHPNFPKSQYKYNNIFINNCPVLILEKIGHGFIIVSEKTLILNAEQNYQFIYEIIMNVFMMSYYKTKEHSSWITNVPVDYMGEINNAYNLNHDIIRLDNLLKNNNYKIDDCVLISVDVLSSGIVFGGVKSKNIMLFKKLDIKDPIKQDSQISIYTKRNTIMYYNASDINTVEGVLDIKWDKSVTGIYILIAPYKSTELAINIEKGFSLRMENTKFVNILCCKNNIMQLIIEPLYNKDEHGVKLSTIEVIKNIETVNYDMRILGGGLPDGEENDYNLLDIGSLNGRPYRIGSGLIITLPKRLKEHEDLIKNEVLKHCSSGDYPIIIFE